MTTGPQLPLELLTAVAREFPPEEWAHALAISLEESGWNAFALYDTTDPEHPCGSFVPTGANEFVVTAERSVGYFQINVCAHYVSEWQRLYNAQFNTEIAAQIWKSQGWSAWYSSAQLLGLI